MDDSDAPEIKSMPPTPLPLGSSRCYRWTSNTAAQNSLFSDSPAVIEKPPLDATWRKPVPRGRIRDLVAAFDQCARFEQSTDFKNSVNDENKPLITVKREPGSRSAGDQFKTPQTSTPKRPSSTEKRHMRTGLDLNKLEKPADEEPQRLSPLTQRHQGRRGTQAVVFKSSPLAQSAPESLFPANVRKLTQKMEMEMRRESSYRMINEAHVSISDLRREQLYMMDEKENVAPHYPLEYSKSEEDLENEKLFYEDTKDFAQMSIHNNTDEAMGDEYEEEKTLDRTFTGGESEDVILEAAEKVSESSPKFTSSPTLFTPYAGQPVTEYRITENEGAHKVVKQLQPPAALATSTPFGTINRKGTPSSSADFQNSFVSSISNFSAVDHANDSRRQISRLIDSIDKTRHHIQLAELALIEAKNSRIVVQELASQRVLLICRERLKLQLEEIRRLQALSVVRHPPPPINRHFKSTMVISNIALQLNKSFQSRGSFAFIVVLKCRSEVEATGVVTLLAHFQTRLNQIQFAEHLHFSNLPVDFVIGMEVYMMRVPEYKPPERTCAAFLAEKVRNIFVPSHAVSRRPITNTTHQNHQLLLNKTTTSLPGNYSAPECDFKFCGRLTLDRDSAGDRHFYLDDAIYPLEGTVKLNSHCSSLPEAIDVEYRGYLYLFHDPTTPAVRVNEAPSWHRYWAMLHRGIIFFWSNPIDEKQEKTPLSQIDLTKCTNQSIEESHEKSNNADHEFHIELLIDQDPCRLEKRRVTLAAESSDHLSSWLNAINDTLYVLRS
ncbi:unnamed protein product [Caenorhabditis brenneri]